MSHDAPSVAQALIHQMERFRDCMMAGGSLVGCLGPGVPGPSFPHKPIPGECLIRTEEINKEIFSDIDKAMAISTALGEMLMKAGIEFSNDKTVRGEGQNQVGTTIQKRNRKMAIEKPTSKKKRPRLKGNFLIQGRIDMTEKLPVPPGLEAMAYAFDARGQFLGSGKINAKGRFDYGCQPLRTDGLPGVHRTGCKTAENSPTNGLPCMKFAAAATKGFSDPLAIANATPMPGTAELRGASWAPNPSPPISPNEPPPQGRGNCPLPASERFSLISHDLASRLDNLTLAGRVPAWRYFPHCFYSREVVCETITDENGYFRCCFDWWPSHFRRGRLKFLPPSRSPRD